VDDEGFRVGTMKKSNLFTAAGGTRVWMAEGKWHREDGPAIEYPNGTKEWWLNGIQYNCLEWILKVYELENS